MKLKDKYKGVILIIASAFCFALMSTFIRLSGDLPAIEKSFFRNAVAFVFAAAVLIKNKAGIKIKKGDLKYLLLRSVFGTAGVVCNFYAIDRLLLSDASMLNKMSPFFAVVFSFLLLKEKATAFQCAAVVTAFAGSLLILKPSFANLNFFPSAVGFLGGLSAGAAYTFVRILGNRGVKGPVVVMFFSAFSCITLLPLMAADFKPMSIIQLVFLLLCGLCAAGGQFTITAAYMYAPAKEISVYDYSQIIFTSAIGFFVFGQIPDALSVIGYVVIISMAVIMFIYNGRNPKKSAEKALKKAGDFKPQ